MESKYFGNQEQEINNSRVDFELVEKKSGLSSKEIKEVNKYVFYPKNTPIEQINQIVKSRTEEIAKCHNSNDHKKLKIIALKIFNSLSMKSYNTRFAEKNIKEHKIFKINEIIQDNKLETINKIKKMKKYSKKAGFNGINLLSNEYLLRNELIWFLSNDPKNIQKISELYKKYFDNYVGFIEEKNDKTNNLDTKNKIPKIEETDLIDPVHTLNFHLKNEKISQKIKDYWDRIAGIF